MKVMLTAGEQDVLLELFPSYPWRRGMVEISENGIEKIRKAQAELEKEAGQLTGTRKFPVNKAYHAELLSRVIGKYESGSITSPSPGPTG